jgi:DNA replication and repair protein RecF
LINKEATEAHITLRLKSTYGIENKIDIQLDKGKTKKILVNSAPISKMGELFGVLNVVFFGPQDLQLIQAGPAERRRFMDIELCQIDKSYYLNLRWYFGALRQRNSLLKRLQKERSLIDMLDVYDAELCKSFEKIVERRNEFIERLSETAAKIHLRLSDGLENLKLTYKCETPAGMLAERLKESRERDILNGSTSHGIHKDDIYFTVNGASARSFASQGQQRSACISTKLAEIEIIKEVIGETPVFLLDDVLSELDENRRKILISSVGEDVQTIITCTGIEQSIKDVSDKARIFKVDNGEIVE